MTVQEALGRGAARLAAAGIDSPLLDASLLLAEALGLDRSRLILAYPDPLPGAARLRFEGFLERRLAGDCTAYILGRKEFRALEFTVSPAVLVPRPDTETLVEAALHWCKKLAGKNGPLGRDLRLLDLCTGSGAVAVALKHEAPGLEVCASDISPEALAIAGINAERLLKDSKVRLVQSDLFSRITGSFHLITANPPYICSGDLEGLSPEVKREPRLALDGGPGGLDLIRALIAGAPEHLYPGGLLLLEADPRQMKQVRLELETGGFKGIQSYRDLSGAERVIGGFVYGKQP
ncbi:MAG: peptide chain release factor N(5)-glutamine methyltransferase [Treponema sp.]|nr:peptide chain release factor N(5)-glutamine methyltransferase [Treponema sp.]